jgi:hypothetical protein
MTSQPSVDTGGALVGGEFVAPAAELARWTIVALAGLTLTAALLVASRRVAGALSAPLEVPLLLTSGFLWAAATVGVREAWNRLSIDRRHSRLELTVWIAPTAALLLLGAALSLPGTSVAGLAAFWGLLVLEEVWSWRRAPWRRRAARVQPEPAPKPSAPQPSNVQMPAAPAERKQSDQATLGVDDCPPEQVIQRLTRSRDSAGVDHLSGWLRMPFAAGQRTASIHVAFCPPFGRVPELTVEQADGPTTRIKTAQLLPHGTRLDLKLSRSVDNEESVLLRFSAQTAGN